MKMVERNAIPFFNLFKSYPHPFDQINYESINKPTDKWAKYEISKFMLTYVHFRIFLAGVKWNLGDNIEAQRILQKTRDDQYHSSTHIKPGLSPLIPEIDKLIDA